MYKIEITLKDNRVILDTAKTYDSFQEILEQIELIQKKGFFYSTLMNETFIHPWHNVLSIRVIEDA